MFGIKGRLERENRGKAIDALRDSVNASFAPRPYLWANVVKDLDANLFGDFRKTKIKFGKVNQDKKIRRRGS
jgi:hypothetical protein